MFDFFATPWAANLEPYQVPLSMEFSRQEYWNGLPFPSPGDLSDPGIKPTPLMSPALAGRFFTTTATWKASFLMKMHILYTHDLSFHLPTTSIYQDQSQSMVGNPEVRDLCLPVIFPLLLRAATVLTSQSLVLP